MADFKKILFPVDFSPSCEDVVPHVLAMAKHFGSRIVTLSVVDLLPMGTAGHEALPPYDIDRMKQQREQKLAVFVRERFPKADVETLVEVGEAARTITATVEREGIDLVMMPTRGLGAFRRYLIGSVTSKVLHDCPCPVWTSVHKEQGTQPLATSGGVLCAVNLETESIPLLQWAAQFAAALSTTLGVIHVIPAVDEESQNPGVIEVRKYLFDQAREKWKGIQISANINVDLRLAGGNISRGVASAAERDRTNVVVIARSNMKQALGGLRTQAYAIIRESPCPVIAI